MGSGKTFTLALIALTLMSLVTLSSVTVKASPKTITVPDDYPTIQEAINNASAGDTVFVKSGTYYYTGYSFIDGITIDKSISLVGENPQTTILKPLYYSHYGTQAGIHITADEVTISGFTITGEVDAAAPGIPETWLPPFGGSIKGVVQEFGILINKLNPNEINSTYPSNCKIIGNIIINNSLAAVSDSGFNTLISGNTILGGTGLSETGVNSVISNNTIKSTDNFAIDIPSAENITIKENSIIENGNSKYGSPEEQGAIVIGGTGPWYSNSDKTSGVSIFNNNITRNIGIGIEFGESNNSSVYNNNIVGNVYGVFLPNLELGYKESNNFVYDNNFIDNSQNVFVQLSRKLNGTLFKNSTDIVSWDNGKMGNYWSDYQAKYPNATEVDSSGVGNISYAIDANNTDYYPLMQEVNLSASPTPTPTVPELSWLVIAPLLLSMLSAAVIVKHRKTANFE